MAIGSSNHQDPITIRLPSGLKAVLDAPTTSISVNDLTGVDVEHTDHVVGPHRGESGPVRAERRPTDPDLTAARAILVLELEQLVAGGGIPDADGAVVTGGGEHRPVAAEGDVVDVDVVAVERAHRRAGGRRRGCRSGPMSSGPSVTKMVPSGLQSNAPPTPGKLRTTRDAVTARCSACYGLGEHRPVAGPRLVDRRQRQQHAALGIVGDVGVGRGGELAGGRHPAFRLGFAAFPPGLAALVEGDEAADEGDDEGDGDGGELDAEPAVGPRLACDPLGLLALLAVALVPAGVEELSLRFGQLAGPSLATSRATSRRAPRYSAPGSRPSSTQLAAASRRCPSTMIASRSSAIQSRSRGHSRSNASWASSTVGTRVWGWRSRVSSRAWAHRSIGGVDGRVGDEAGQLGTRGAPPRRLALGADDDEPLEHLPHRGALIVVERGVEQLGPRGDRPVDSAELPVGGQCETLVGAAFGQLVQRELQRRQRRRLVRRRR